MAIVSLVCPSKILNDDLGSIGELMVTEIITGQRRDIKNNVQRLIIEEGRTELDALDFLETLRWDRRQIDVTIKIFLYWKAKENRLMEETAAVSASPSVNIYKLDRTITTVQQVWNEWNDGIGRNPSIKSLQHRFGSEWRVKGDSAEHQARMCIVNEIMRRVAKDYTNEIIPRLAKNDASVKKAIDSLQSMKKVNGYNPLATLIRKRNLVDKSGNPDCRPNPIFRMDKNLRSVHEIYGEFAVGTDVLLSIEELEDWYKLKWRHPEDFSRYKNAKALVKEVRKLQQEGMSEMEALNDLESRRDSLGLDRFIKKLREVKA
ncbi:hypothetical protein BGZ76_005406 [Entomortierella beljakovae]|nr:hypothetical protein BGZ76_005406 [Entomortierella beljakovae]